MYIDMHVLVNGGGGEGGEEWKADSLPKTLGMSRPRSLAWTQISRPLLLIQ